MIQFQATFGGYSGRPCSVFSAYDPESEVLVIGVEAEFRRERRDACTVITNLPELTRDTLFTEDRLADAIRAFYALKNGVASDGKGNRLAFNERAARANPEAAIEQDGMDERGQKYRIAEGITSAQVAVLATCLHVYKQQAINAALETSDILLRLARGEAVTI